MIRIILWAALCAGTPAMSVAQVAASQATSADEDRVSIAIELLKAGDAAKAIDLTNEIEKTLKLAKAKPTDPALVNCMHVRGVAQHRLGQFKAAADSLQRTMPLAAANRSIVVNLAVCDLRDLALLPRSIKNLQAYASANTTDEEVINLWGMAMAKLADANKVGGTKAKEWASAYAVVDVQLERTRPGLYHWGSEWIGQAEHARIEDLRRQATFAVDSARLNVRNAEGDLRQAKRNLAEAMAISVGGRSGSEIARRREYRDREIARTAAVVDLAQRRLDDANADAARAADGFPKPTWAVSERMVDPILIR